MDPEHNAPTNGAENEEKKDLDEKPSALQSKPPHTADHSSSNGSDKMSSSSVDMAGVVRATSRRELNDDEISDGRQSTGKPPSQQSLMSVSHHSQTSVWESDFNDMEETSYGEDDDDFYGLHGQNGAAVPGAGPPGAAFNGGRGQEYNNPHIQQTYPIPPAQSTPSDDPSPPKHTSSFTSAASRGSAASKSSGASSRRSRRGSMRVPGDEGSSQSMRETDEQRREREFKDRLDRLERQQSRNRVQQPKPRETCKCSRDLIPVAASLLLLAVGIAVAIYVLFAKGSDNESSAPQTAPVSGPTPAPTLDPNPFRRHLQWNHRPPTLKACKAIRNGRPVLGQDLMASIKVDATMDVTTYEDIIDPNSLILLKEFQDVAKERIIPSLAGCLDRHEESKLGRVRTVSSKTRRIQRIQEETAHYTIASGKVTEITWEASSSCYERPDMHGPCYRVVLGFQFWHRGGQDNFSMEALVDEMFNDQMMARMSTGDIISQAQMISVVQR